MKKNKIIIISGILLFSFSNLYAQEIFLNNTFQHKITVVKKEVKTVPVNSNENLEEIKEYKENNIKTIIHQDQKIKEIIKEEVKKEVKKIVQNKEEELDGVFPISHLQEKRDFDKIIFNKIKFANNDWERVKIYYNLLEENKAEILNKIKKHKTERIFSKFDFLINKLDKVKTDINENIDYLKKRAIDVTSLNNDLIDLNINIDKARTERGKAWIKMQKINFENKAEKQNTLKQLELVKKDLLASKFAIRNAYINSKKLLSSIKHKLSDLENN